MTDAAQAVLPVLELFRLDGRVAVVTGASSRLGAGLAVALAEAGADVVLGESRLGSLGGVVAEVESTGRAALPVRIDVTDPASCAALVAAAEDRFGRIDVLVNNAQVPRPTGSPETFQPTVDVDVAGSFSMAEACSRVMSPGSAIVTVASILRRIRSHGALTARAAGTAAVIGLTRDLARRWSGPRGIRVNAVAAGYLSSELTPDLPVRPLEEIIRQTCALGRIGTQREVDAAVVFLASPAASYITGVTLPVDGGLAGH